MIWFIFKYLCVSVVLVFNLGMLLSSSESQFLLLLGYAGSFGVATLSYLDYGDWLSLKFWRK